jgi:hypothetical protein
MINIYYRIDVKLMLSILHYSNSNWFFKNYSLFTITISISFSNNLI